MRPLSFVSFQLGLVAVAPLAWCVSSASAQMMISPEWISAYAGAPAAREAAPGDPEMEPVVSLASLVLALSEALGDGSLVLGPKAALAIELQLRALVDQPVLPRAEADRIASELAGLLEPRQLIVLSGIARDRNYAANSRLLGAESATANPFYDPGSIPGFGARFVLAHLTAALRPAD